MCNLLLRHMQRMQRCNCNYHSYRIQCIHRKTNHNLLTKYARLVPENYTVLSGNQIPPLRRNNAQRFTVNKTSSHSNRPSPPHRRTEIWGFVTSNQQSGGSPVLPPTEPFSLSVKVHSTRRGWTGHGGHTFQHHRLETGTHPLRSPQPAKESGRRVLWM